MTEAGEKPTGALITSIQVGGVAYHLGNPMFIPSGGLVNVIAGDPPKIHITTASMSPGCKVTVSIGKPPGEWVAVGERLPELGAYVLVWMEEGAYAKVGVFNQLYQGPAIFTEVWPVKGVDLSGRVTHWMELPAGPGGGR